MSTFPTPGSGSGKNPSCFVIMPISDVDPYPSGHFRRVYDHLIAPACEQAGFTPLLASDVKETNLIVLDILERLFHSAMVICDLSSRNPNVLFELGFRQAFNRPVALIRDNLTDRIFDISGLRDIEYDSSLRVDSVHIAIAEIAERIRLTYNASSRGNVGINSLIQLMSIDAAAVPRRSELSSETQLVLNAIRDLADRVTDMENVSSANVTVRRGFATLKKVEVDFAGDPLEISSFCSSLLLHFAVESVSEPITKFGDYTTGSVVTFRIHSSYSLDRFEHLVRVNLPDSLEVVSIRELDS